MSNEPDDIDAIADIQRSQAAFMGWVIAGLLLVPIVDGVACGAALLIAGVVSSVAEAYSNTTVMSWFVAMTFCTTIGFSHWIYVVPLSVGAVFAKRQGFAIGLLISAALICLLSGTLFGGLAMCAGLFVM
jgi:hypothetical protein